MESTHPFSVSFAPCFQGILCRSRLFFRMFLEKLFQICADRFIMKQKWRCFSPFLLSPSSRRAWIEIASSQSPRSGSLRSPSSRRAYIKSSLHPAARIILFAGRSSVRRATTFFHANQRRDRVLRSRRSEHIGHLILLHDSRQIPAVAVITQQADPAKLCCKVHLLR